MSVRREQPPSTGTGVRLAGNLLHGLCSENSHHAREHNETLELTGVCGTLIMGGWETEDQCCFGIK